SPLYAIPPDQHEAWIEAALPRLSDGPPFIRRLSDGRYLRIAGTPTRTGGRILALRDVSEDVKAKETIELENAMRKEQEQRLAEALAREREIVAQQRRFVAVTAHEFRTPLTIIDGAAQRLARYAEQMVPADLRERAARIRVAVQRMSELVDTTLNSAQFDEGRIAVNAAPLDLAELVGGVARRLTGMAPEFDIVVSLPPAPLSIEGDPRLLDQVFANLISNAIKYSGASRRVEVSAIAEGEVVVVRVRDYGIGVPEAEIGQLFTRFFRASTAKGLPGTGIGLNLVRELVTLHRGEVRVESRVGEGTTFVVTLPRRAPTIAGGDADGGAVERIDRFSRAGSRPS
ncbi:MAG: hypothetical protein FJX57_20820, partial [Alphaproteobacteria bacterium]|nr:hypothetical protein [Alphaproteobacteria bacterium]